MSSIKRTASSIRRLAFYTGIGVGIRSKRIHGSQTSRPWKPQGASLGSNSHLNPMAEATGDGDQEHRSSC